MSHSILCCCVFVRVAILCYVADCPYPLMVQFKPLTDEILFSSSTSLYDYLPPSFGADQVLTLHQDSTVYLCCIVRLSDSHIVWTASSFCHYCFLCVLNSRLRRHVCVWLCLLLHLDEQVALRLFLRNLLRMCFTSSLSSLLMSSVTIRQ